MKILVFGAGVLGCNLARNFFRAGKDVTLLTRGAWGESIPKNGLRIKDKFSPRMSVSRIPVTAELKAEDKYDVIFIVLRYTLMAWEPHRNDWYSAEIQKTPEDLRNALLGTYANFLEDKITGNDRDLTVTETGEIQQRCRELLEKCRET